MQNEIMALDSKGKEHVLVRLSVEIWFDGEKVEISNSIHVENDTVVAKSSSKDDTNVYYKRYQR